MTPRTNVLTASLLAVLLLAAGPAYALTVGDNVTISDGRAAYYPGSWWGHEGNEDNEVEPYLSTMGQSWDLEGFFLDDTALTVVAGYDMIAATGYRRIGDVFIDIDGDMGEGGTANNYGYEFVVDLNLAASSYSIYELTVASDFLLTTVVSESSPWRWAGGGRLVESGVLLANQSGLGGDEVGDMTSYGGYPQDTHSAFTVDIAAIFADPNDWEFWSHCTMNCGNDNLAGYGDFTRRVPDMASTALLLGLALSAMGILRQRLA